MMQSNLLLSFFKNNSSWCGLLIVFGAFIVSFSTADAAATAFNRNLSLGSVGVDVKLLQMLLNADIDTTVALTGSGSPGNETVYFGRATQTAVKKFQEKYKTEVLIPAGLAYGTGYVGSLTRAKMGTLAENLAKNKTPVGISALPPNSVATSTVTPRVFSVSPDRVVAGNVVVITGENFTPTGNTVVLGDGPISKRFSGLPSPDGKTIMFTYEPPVLETMTEAQIRALPAKLFAKINDPITAKGLTLSEVINNKYSNFKNLQDFGAFLQKNGHSLNDIYHFFYITVENQKGKGMSKVALLHGLPALPFQTATNGTEANKLLGYVSKVIKFFIPTANAQLAGGGFDVGMIMFCDCSGGELVWLEDYAGMGTDFYWFYPGFVPIAGTGLVPSMWLGFYEPYAGQCWIGADPYCIPFLSNIPINPWGASM